MYGNPHIESFGSTIEKDGILSRDLNFKFNQSGEKKSKNSKQSETRKKSGYDCLEANDLQLKKLRSDNAGGSKDFRNYGFPPENKIDLDSDSRDDFIKKKKNIKDEKNHIEKNKNDNKM